MIVLDTLKTLVLNTFEKNKNIITNIFRTQAYDSKMCGYICTGFIDFMSKDKSLAYLQTSAYHAIPKWIE